MSAPSETNAGRPTARVIVLMIRLIEGIVIALMSIIATVVIIEVGLRWLGGGRSLIITDELTRYLMIWTAMLGAVLLVHEDGHIRISVLPDVLPRWGRIVCAVLSQLVVLGFLGVLIVVSVMNWPETMGQKAITLGVSMAWFTSALPITGALMVLLILYDMVETLRGRRG